MFNNCKLAYEDYNWTAIYYKCKLVKNLSITTKNIFVYNLNFNEINF